MITLQGTSLRANGVYEDRSVSPRPFIGYGRAGSLV